MNLGPHHAPLIATKLKDSAVLSMNIRDNNLGPKGAAAIAEALKSGSSVLTDLNLSGNQLCGVNWLGIGTYDLSGIEALAAALGSGSAVLTVLNLSNNYLKAKAGVKLASALRVNAVLKSINLSNNYLDAEAGVALASALKVNAVLTDLNLKSNNLDLTGAVAIAEALKSGSSVLKSLDLSFNLLGAEAGKALVSELNGNNVLTAIGIYGNDFDMQVIDDFRQQIPALSILSR